MLQHTDEGTVTLATASADTTACLWSAEGKKLHTLAGHTDRCRSEMMRRMQRGLLHFWCGWHHEPQMQ